MSRWRVIFSENAEGDFLKLTKVIRKRIIEKLEWFADNFESITPIPLTGRYAGFYKLRIGDWRVVYEIDWECSRIIVILVGHRSDIYNI